MTKVNGEMQSSDAADVDSKAIVNNKGDGSVYHLNDLNATYIKVDVDAKNPPRRRLFWFVRKWLVIPICLLYFGVFTSSFMVIQQFIYVKIQRQKYPNVTIDMSTAVCQANESDPDYEIQTKVQQESAKWMSYFALAFGIPSIFSDLILGSYTDRFGRKFLFFLPCIGALLHVVINAVGIYTDFALYWYIPVCIVDGLSGHAFGLLLVAFSYTADITKPGRERSFGIVIIELAIGIGIAGFSLSTGFFIQDLGFFWPMFSAAVMSILAVILVILMPETYTKEKRTEASSALENLHNAFKLFFGKEYAGERWIYNILISTFTLTIFTALGRANVELLYQLNNPFCWDPKRLSLFMALRSGAQQVVGMALVKPLQRISSDESIAMIGCVSFMAGFALEGLAQTDEALYAAAAASSLGLLTVPMVRAIMSKRTSPDKQGAVFASLACVESAASVVGVVAANAIYDATISFFKGFVFFVFVLCNIISFILLLIYKIGRPTKREHSRRIFETQADISDTAE